MLWGLLRGNLGLGGRLRGSLLRGWFGGSLLWGWFRGSLLWGRFRGGWLGCGVLLWL